MKSTVLILPTLAASKSNFENTAYFFALFYLKLKFQAFPYVYLILHLCVYFFRNILLKSVLRKRKDDRKWVNKK